MVPCDVLKISYCNSEKACSLRGTVVKLNQNGMTQQGLDDLKGFHGKAKVSKWQIARYIYLNLLL